MKKLSLKQLIDSCDLPHLRDGGTWRCPGSFMQLTAYARRLRRLGCADVFIRQMFEYLYSNAVAEKVLDNESRRGIQVRVFLRELAEVRQIKYPPQPSISQPDPPQPADAPAIIGDLPPLLGSLIC